MKILASTLYHKSHYPESHYQHSISNGTGLQKFYFSFTNIFFEKIEHHLYRMHFNTLLFCLVFRHNYSFLYNFLSIYSKIRKCPLVFKTNGCLSFRKNPSISVLEKIVTLNIVGNFSVKRSCWSPC